MLNPRQKVHRRSSGSPINIRHDVTREETSTSLSKRSEHAHGPWERKFPLEEPDDELQDRIYEQWIVDGILRDDSGDTRLSDDVEPKQVHGPSSDPESDLDSLLGPLTEPRTGDRSSDDLDTSEQIRTKINKGPLLPPVIYATCTTSWYRHKTLRTESLTWKNAYSVEMRKLLPIRSTHAEMSFHMMANCDCYDY